VLSAKEALQHPQFVARDMVLATDGGPQLAPPLRLSDWEFSLRCTAPAAGANSDEILAEAGFSRDEIGALRQSSVIG
jgi:crotonobetainyl-CoA:carnitine CoA-transferase CaiB-like acyl-CoA transferase